MLSTGNRSSRECAEVPHRGDDCQHFWDAREAKGCHTSHRKLEKGRRHLPPREVCRPQSGNCDRSRTTATPPSSHHHYAKGVYGKKTSNKLGRQAIQASVASYHSLRRDRQGPSSLIVNFETSRSFRVVHHSRADPQPWHQAALVSQQLSGHNQRCAVHECLVPAFLRTCRRPHH